MTASYRAEQLATAKAEYATHRAAFDALDAVGLAAMTRAQKRAWRAAAAELEFWGNKVAFLTHAA